MKEKDLIELITSGVESSSDEDIETSRLEMLSELREDSKGNVDWEEVEAQHRPGGHGFSSALHTIQLYMDSLQQHVLANPAVALDDGCYRAAFRAHEALARSFHELASVALEEALDEIDGEEDENEAGAGRA